ncbi:MAG TPA: mechanosensitive ion channel family protein [Deferrisomatales bacterium]|nr:mechanosensitive ion channel family protein [Deferrisomatales bacterium]
MNQQVELLDQARRTAVDLAIQFGPRALVALVILAIGFYVGRWVGGVVARMLARFQLEPPVNQLLVRLVRVGVLGLFVIMALQNLGVELLPLIAGLGVAGAGVALAMQGVMGNVVAGLSIIFTRPFRVGEYVSMVGEEGRVEEIGLFTTVLGHPDRSRVVIPNRKIVGDILHNYGEIRQVEAVVGVAYDTDLNGAFAAIQELLRANPRVLHEPEPVVRVVELADSSITIAVKPWVSVPDFGAASGEINKALVEMFRARAIAIPFPQREVRLLGEGA